MIKKYGFTLIELLVVISIISILAGVGMVSFSAVQVRARDSQRKADLKTIQQALELYYNSQAPPQYPSSVSFGGSWEPYLKKVPQDPKPPRQYKYSVVVVNNTNQKYTLSSDLENDSDLARTAGCQSADSTHDLCVYNP